MNEFNIYIAKNGSDENTGSEKSPFLTPEKGRDKATEYVKNGFSGQINVIFDKGVYELDKTFEILKEHSGNENVKIRYCGKEGEEVCFSGGLTLKGSDFVPLSDEDYEGRIEKRYRDKILCLDLKKFTDKRTERQKRSGFFQNTPPAANELFVDNRAEPLGGYPKNDKRLQVKNIIFPGSTAKASYGDRSKDPYTDYGYSKEDYAIIGYDFENADKWGKARDAYFKYVESYIDANIAVDHIDTEKKEIHLGDRMHGIITNTSYTSSFRVYNLLEEVTTPGEYYIDRVNEIVFYYPYEGFNPDSKVQISYLKEPLLAMEDCQYIEFENISFENTRGMAIYSENCENTAIKNCNIRNIGMIGIMFGVGVDETFNIVHNRSLKPKKRALGHIKGHMWEEPTFFRNAGKNNIVSGCHIYNLGCGGAILDGGNRKNLESGNNHIVGCDIHNYNRIDISYKPAVRIYGVGNGVSFCKIHEAEHQAIEFAGNDLYVAYNEIYRCASTCFDNAAIYVGTEEGMVNSANIHIFGNYFHENGSMINEKIGISGLRSECYDIYLDSAPGISIYNNIFEKSRVSEAIFINSDSMCNNIYNNVFCDVSPVIMSIRTLTECSRAVSKSRSYDPFAVFDLNEEEEKIWREKYPYMKNYFDMTLLPYLGEKFNRNIQFGKGHFLRGASAMVEFEDNMKFYDTSLVNDVKTSDYIFDSDSVVFEKCPKFENIPVKYIANYPLYKKEVLNIK